MTEVRFLSAGEQGLVIEFGSTIDFGINSRVHQTAQLLKEKLTCEIIEVVPTYRSLMVYFNPLYIKRDDLIRKVEELLIIAATEAKEQGNGKVVDIPVCYGGEYGPDIAFVAQHNGLSEEEVIQIHTSIPYPVYMLGFTPGFPYLGGMSERIATPRLEKPRTRIPAGSVGIAGSQTGLYPIESPGGWQLIGRTPVKAFNLDSAKPFLFEAGDYLRFVAISPEEYEQIQAEVGAGRYVPVTGRLVGGVVAR